MVESCSLYLQIFLIQNKIRRCMHFSGRIRWCCPNRDHATECYQWAHLPSYRIADVMKFSCRGSSADTIPTFSTRECTVDQRAKIRYSKHGSKLFPMHELLCTVCTNQFSNYKIPGNVEIKGSNGFKNTISFPSKKNLSFHKSPLKFCSTRDLVLSLKTALYFRISYLSIYYYPHLISYANVVPDDANFCPALA